MPHPLHVAFIWHQHQPLYKSRQSNSAEGQYRLPWVRLHGTKDYLDLVLLLEQYPKLHQTVNLVPSLIMQLEDYIAGTALDPYLTAALTPIEQLTQAQKEFIVAHFFDGNHRTLIDPHPRYSELYEIRQAKGQRWCFENWADDDFGDLLAWHNLSWIDPLFWDDPQISGWLKKDRGFTLADRQHIYSKQREILRRIIPQHKKMQNAGQLEITTTPYTHPILPLLADTNSGRVAVRDLPLPEQRFQWAEDMPRHLRKAKEMYSDRFDRAPRGLWPSEQSVSPAILPDISQAGFEWICSDEAVLGWTLDHFFQRDEKSHITAPEKLYQPYRLETPHGDLAIVFRDHRLSDLIGFTYGGMPAAAAATDLVTQLHTIAQNLQAQQDSGTTSLDEPWLVTIALDGENCWEFYEQDGKPFLESLYSQLSDDANIKLVTVSEYLDQFPPRETLPAAKLHSGSWVDGSFTTWIGDPAKNRAWDLLTTARQTLANHPEATEATNPEAWEALYAAEGSDWFWWFGEGHSSNQDAMFDQLFREHLMALYQSLNEPIPDNVRRPIETHTTRDTRQPEGYVNARIDGSGDEQDWDKAGRIELGGARGTMHQSSAIQRLWYGVNHHNLYLRLDFKAGIKIGSDVPSELNLFWYYSNKTMHNSPIPLVELASQSPLDHHYHHHLGINLLTKTIWLQEAIEHWRWESRATRAQIGLDRCLELSLPWTDLGIEPDATLQLILVMSEGGRYRQLIPETGMINLTIP
ncbi:glycoside hydrolase [filamentous cyanobacterium LEGE 11480]|uniref:Glycoside hydrolase n=1 Tax=Romeriopsis navalis LEGE 11480 TaxID=2777977 RepID=A0A928VQN0_9CYAN|nr:glycoside hydrolase [Romeriopsis navalis]MBE9030820.1 glycoside hydrolase [Romeriopsis navalis LEGE 11480]